MTLADLSIRNPVFAWMLMAFLVVFGAICFQDLGISHMPDVDFPNVGVTVTYEGASPEIIESDVIDPIEDAVMSVQLRDKFQTLKGVGEIFMGGYRDRSMRVWLKLEEMEARELAVEDVVAALRREHVEVPAGRIESGTREMNVRSLGETPPWRSSAGSWWPGGTGPPCSSSRSRSSRTGWRTAAAWRGPSGSPPWAWESRSSTAPTPSRWPASCAPGWRSFSRRSPRA